MDTFEDSQNNVEKALTAKDKFKELYWKKNREQFNVIGIGEEYIFNILSAETDPDMFEISETDVVEVFFVKVYLFDINDVVALNLPSSIDDVDVRYFSVKDFQ